MKLHYTQINVLREYAVTVAEQEMLNQVVNAGGYTDGLHKTEMDILLNIEKAAKSDGRRINLSRKDKETKRGTVAGKVATEVAGDLSVNNAVEDGFKLKGGTVQYNKRGEMTQAWVRVSEDADAKYEAFKAAVNAQCESVPRFKPVKQNSKVNQQLMNVIPFGDPHFGMMAWGEEVGDDFDLKIAERDLCAAAADLINRAPAAKRAVVVSLGDFFHADNMAGTTARSGNNLDMDGRLPKMFRAGVKAFRTIIESALDKHEIVEVVIAQGNHDEVLANALSILLANVYENEERVIVHTSPAHRHYVEHGKVLLGITHGHETRDTELPLIMATERAEQWGKTKFRYFYRGHHHQDKVSEFNGCKVEQFRTLAAGDSYAVHHGWMSGRDVKCITFHENFGEVSRLTCSVEMLRGSV